MWTIEYYEQADTTQPAEVFEDDRFYITVTHAISPVREESDESV